MKTLNGIRTLAFVAFLGSVFFAYLHHGFLRNYPNDSLSARWLAQRNDYLIAAAVALGIVLLCSLVIWLAENAAQKREQREQDLVASTEKRVHAERDKSERINGRNARQVQERWDRESNPA